MPKDSCNNIFTSTLMVYLMVSSQKSSFRPWAFNYTQIEGLKLSQKYPITMSLFGVAIGSNSHKIACKCFRYAAQSRTSFN